MSKKIAFVPGLDPTLPDVTITLGGKDRQLAFDFSAILLVEKLTGINLMRQIAVPDISVSDLAAALYAALLKDDPELTLEQAGRLITFRNRQTIHLAVLEAWVGSMPEAKPEQPGEDIAQAPPKA